MAAPRTALLEACLGVCEASSTMVRAVYDLVPKCGSGAAMLKADNSEFTLADGFVQARAPAALLAPTMRG